MSREPGYCLHRPTGQAYVRLNGRMFYLGPYDSDESRAKYAALKAEWLVNRKAAKFTSDGAGPTMAGIGLAFLDYAESYYPPRNRA